LERSFIKILLKVAVGLLHYNPKGVGYFSDIRFSSRHRVSVFSPSAGLKNKQLDREKRLKK
jgi:hypothetical protein